jgi:hypothetical protein
MEFLSMPFVSDPLFAFGFVHPAVAIGGAALIASPIIIHLINRMRFRRVRFAAMEFLLQSQQRNRRRLLLEQLLLLLMRILLVLGLTALIAKLLLDSSEFSLPTDEKAHHVVLLDDSGSMNDQWGDTTAFKEAAKVVKDLVAKGSERPGTQKLTLIRLSRPDERLYDQVDVNRELITGVEEKFENLDCSRQQLDLSVGLKAAGKILDEDSSSIKHLHVLSDFRRSDWVGERAITGAIKELDDAKVTVNLVKTVPERHENLALTTLTGQLHTVSAGFAVRMQVGVTNFGRNTASNVRVSLKLDGEKLPLVVPFEKIEAGEEVVTEQYVTFENAGKHQLHALLEGDSLRQDNDRFVAIDVAEQNRVLIVNGVPASDEAEYIADAVGDPVVTGWSPQIVTVDDLDRQPLHSFDCVYLVNVPEIPPAELEALREYVANGGGLAWFMGDAVKPDFYNDKLYVKNGKGLFPAPLETAASELPNATEFTPGPDMNAQPTHPIFELLFDDGKSPLLDIVKIDLWLPVAADWERNDNTRQDGVTTIATLRNKEPLFLEHRYGEGTVLTFLSSAGPSWNKWTGDISYPLVVLESLGRIASPGRTITQRMTGAPISFSLPAADFQEEIVIRSPDDASGREVSLKATLTNIPKPGEKADDQPKSDDDKKSDAEAAQPMYELKFDATDRPGVYVARLTDRDGVPQERWFAYNVSRDESSLQLATEKELLKRIGEDDEGNALKNVHIQEAGSRNWIQGQEAGQEVRFWLIVALLALLLAEQLLAYRLSYHSGSGQAGRTQAAGVPA